MELDLYTLLWVLLFACLALSAAVLFVQRGSGSRDALTAWGWSLLVQGLSYPAFGLRLAGWHLASLLLTNLLSAATLSLQILALARFQQDRRTTLPGWSLWGPMPLMAVVVLTLQTDDMWRNVCSGLVLILQCALLAWQARSSGTGAQRERGRWLLVAGSCALLLALAARVAWFAAHPDMSHPLAVPPQAQALTYLVVLLALLTNTLGFVLMQKEHSGHLVEESERRHRQLLEAANEGICVIQDGVFRFVNRRFGEMSGHRPADLLDKPLFVVVAPEDAELARERHRARIAGAADELRYEIRGLTAGGAVRWWEVGGVAIRWQGRPATLNFVTDVTERRALEEDIRKLAFHDPLTGLPNRRLLVDRLQVAIAGCRRNGGTGALMFVDLDHFKRLNDTHGHEAGDRLLSAVGARLRNVVRATDTVARFGGDEFVLLFPTLDPALGDSRQAAQALALKILGVLEEEHQLEVADADAGVRQVTCRSPGSLGVALFDADATADAVMQAADRAMYRAKHAGRNGFEFSA